MLFDILKKNEKPASHNPKSCGMPHSPYLLILFPYAGSPPERKISCRSPGSRPMVPRLPSRSPSGITAPRNRSHTVAGPHRRHTCFPLSRHRKTPEHEIIFRYNKIILYPTFLVNHDIFTFGEFREVSRNLNKIPQNSGVFPLRNSYILQV